MFPHSTKKRPQNTPKTRGSIFPNLAQFTKRSGSGWVVPLQSTICFNLRQVLGSTWKPVLGRCTKTWSAICSSSSPHSAPVWMAAAIRDNTCDAYLANIVQGVLQLWIQQHAAHYIQLPDKVAHRVHSCTRRELFCISVLHYWRWSDYGIFIL